MTFEEFFKKKRIDLLALAKSEPSLFSEFETHYKDMGEKSFDHTKKYWFNKLRRQYQLEPEIKTEKNHTANPLAEQTVTESLIDAMVSSSPKPGFTPRFKVGNMAKPAIAPVDGKEKSTNISEKNVEDTTPKPTYKPRFNVKIIPPKPEE